MKRLRLRRSRNQAGFSLVEALVSSVIFVALLAAVYGSLASATRVKNVQDGYAKMEMDARRAIARIADELRMAGRVANPAPGQPGWPYTFVNGGALGTFNQPARHDPADIHVAADTPAYGDCIEIAFLVPRDNDGDGLLTDAVTGDIEWSTYDVSYIIVTGPDGINRLERWEDSTCTDIMAYHAERITFQTIERDLALGLYEVAVTLYMARPIPGSDAWCQTHLTTRVTMRNADGLFTVAPSAI